MLEWNVFISDYNRKEIKTFNVFDHYGFLQDCADNATKNAKDYAAFVDRLNSNLMYFFWSKCEWEVIITDWPTSGKCEEKIDVYDQIMLNWEQFCRYVWEHAVELRRWRKLERITAKELAEQFKKTEANNGSSYS